MKAFCDKDSTGLEKEYLTKISVFIMLFVFCSFFCMIVDYVWGIHYVINDDVAMREILSGIRSGISDGHAVYIKYPLGWFLSDLYQVCDKVDWYGVFMIGTIILSWGLILYRIFTNEKNISLKISLMCLVSLLFMQHIFQLQWTMCAAISGVSAVLFYLTITTDNRFFQICEKIISIILLLICYMIRDKVFWLVAAVAFFAVIFKEVKSVESKKRAVYEVLAIFGIILLSVGIIEGIDCWAYSSKEWQEYFDFNRARSLVYDYYGVPDYEDHIVFYEKESIPKTTYDNLKNYGFIYDPNINTDNLTKIADYSKEFSQEFSFRDNIHRFLQAFLNNSEFRIIRWSMFLLLLAVVLRAVRLKDKTISLLCILELSVWLIMTLYLIYQGRFPDRIIYTICLIFIFMFIGLFIGQQKQTSINYSKIGIIANLIIIIGCGVHFYQLCGESVMLQQKNLSIYQIRAYADEHSENLYFLPSSSFAQYTDCFDFYGDAYKGKILPTGGWGYKTPVTVKRLESRGIVDIPADLVDRNNIYFFGWADQSIDYIVNSIIDNLERPIKGEVVDSINTSDGTVNVYVMKYDD